MAKKKAAKAPKRRPVKKPVRTPGTRSRKGSKRRTPKRTRTVKGELVAMDAQTAALIPQNKRNSLVAWLSLYMKLEGNAGSDETAKAKTRDLTRFLEFFQQAVNADQIDLWVRSITTGFLKHLERELKEAPSTINRRLATLKHAAKWIQRQRPFVAGDPTERVTELEQDNPEWKGLTDIEVTRLKAAAEQLKHLKKRKSQRPLRDYALFVVLLNTGFRISELLRLDLNQYQGKHLVSVRRKGRAVTRKKFLPKEAREALDEYIEAERGSGPGPLFCSKTGRRLARQDAHDVLKGIEKQANANLPDDRKITLSAHPLRHTNLRKLAREFGVEFAREESGQVSDRYIWRYVQPSEEEKEAALEELF